MDEKSNVENIEYEVMLTFHCAGKLPNRVGIPMMKASNSANLLGSRTG